MAIEGDANGSAAAFRQTTEDRLDEVEEDIAKLREEMAGSLKDVTRTHRLVLEFQVETRLALKKIMQKLEHLTPTTPGDRSDG